MMPSAAPSPDVAPRRREFPLLVGAHEQYNLVRFDEKLYGIPQSLGPVNLHVPAEVDRPEILVGESEEQVIAGIEAVLRARPVEYAGWLPAFRAFGNCGAHPQFAHTAQPPEGYRFVRSQPGLALPAASWRQGWRRRARTAVARAGAALAMGRLAAHCLAAGGRPAAVARFLWSRHLPSQALLPASQHLVFLTSVPYTWGQYPWVIEIEDVISLFFPFVHNGQTEDLRIQKSPYFPIVRRMLEMPQCRAIVTHMRATERSLPKLFNSPVISQKTYHVPLGVPLAPVCVNQARRDYLDLLFCNSWHQDPRSFYLRGGLDVLEAFDQLQRKYPRLRLTLRTQLPSDLPPRYKAMIERGCVRLLDKFMPAEDWNALRAASHIFLLPSDRVHVVSVLQAMSYGMAVVVSDGWGMEEYVDHGRNGLVVPGRYGRVTWTDEVTGMLRENYRAMERSDPIVVAGLVRSVERLVRDENLRRSLASEARRDVETTFSLQSWNEGLKYVLDRSYPGRSLS